MLLIYASILEYASTLPSALAFASVSIFAHLRKEHLSVFPIFLVVNSTAGQGHRIAESIKELSPERESQSSQVCSSLAM